MAKIGTAHIEIKPVVDQEALDALTVLIERAVALGVKRGMAAVQSNPSRFTCPVQGCTDRINHRH